MLQEILEQKITPELIPGGSQSTEESVGPYALQDFTLYHVIRRGYRPRKIAFLAHHAWSDASVGDWPPGFPEEGRPAYDLGAIRHWLGVFVTRFFGKPVQAVGAAQRPQGEPRRDHEPAGRLADAQRRERHRVAGGDRARHPLSARSA